MVQVFVLSPVRASST